MARVAPPPPCGGKIKTGFVPSSFRCPPPKSNNPTTHTPITRRSRTSAMHFNTFISLAVREYLRDCFPVPSLLICCLVLSTLCAAAPLPSGNEEPNRRARPSVFPPYGSDMPIPEPPSGPSVSIPQPARQVYYVEEPPSPRAGVRAAALPLPPPPPQSEQAYSAPAYRLPPPPSQHWSQHWSQYSEPPPPPQQRPRIEFRRSQDYPPGSPWPQRRGFRPPPPP